MVLKSENFKDSAKSFEEFKEILQKYEINSFSKFNVDYSEKGFLNEKYQISEDMRLQWKNGIPYFPIGRRHYTCHQGKDKNLAKKKKYLEKKQEKAKTDHVFQKSYNLTQTTKKLDCPVSITVFRVYALLQLQLENPTRSQKEAISTKIKDKLRNNENVEGEEVFWFTLPSADAHKNHTQGVISAVTEPVDPLVRSKIKELVREGKRNALVISELLEIFVRTDLKQNDKKRRRFFPDIPTIKGIIKEGKRDIRHSKIDMENTEKLLKSFDKRDLYFRPFIKETISAEELGEDGDNEEEGSCNLSWKSVAKHHFLFVYQNSDMRRLYRRYAGEAVLLDATYRVCKYAIPLYFLVVKTNVNFQVVAVIMSQYETAASICEALEIIKTWNEDIIPKNAMVDFAAEEISALEKVFPGISVFICSFHREQAWNRWLSRSQNSSIPKDEALNRLWKIANAPNEVELQQAVKNLKNWEHYAATPLKNYFENTWEPEIRRWSLAYKPDSMLLNTNNGVERINEELKYRFLDGYRNCQLSEIIGVLINTFLPQRYNTYVTSNLRMSAQYMKYNDQLPHFLHERPKWFIEHMQDKLDYLNFENTDLVKLTGEGSFQVTSKCGKIYSVKFDKENRICSCSCNDFRRTRLLCKHCLIVGEKFKQYHISLISEWLLSNPLFCCDTELLDNNCNQIDSEIIDLENQCDDVISEETQEKTQDAYEELKKRGSNRRKLINKCNSHMRNLGSILWMLPETALLELENNLLELTDRMEGRVNHDVSTGLPVEIDENRKNCNNMPKKVETDKSMKDATNDSIKKQYGKLKACTKRGIAGRVGTKANAIRQASKQISIENETEDADVFIDGHFEIVTDCTLPILHQSSAEESLNHQNDFVNETNRGAAVVKAENTGIGLTKNSVVKVNSGVISATENKNGKTNKRKKLYSSGLSSDIIENECMSNAMLSDIVINYAQAKLKAQWKDPGFQNTLLGQNLSFSIKSSGTQILHVNTNHWVTIQIISNSNINVYDSLGLIPSPDLKRQIAAIVCSVSKCIKITVKAVQKQLPSSNDCGVLAIAFAVSLVMGKDPTIISYDSVQIRKHLKMCLESGVFTPFPETSKRILRVKEQTFACAIYCTCRMPYFNDVKSAGMRMAQCGKCSEWIHKDCGKIPEAAFSHKTYNYVCKNCISYQK